MWSDTYARVFLIRQMVNITLAHSLKINTCSMSAPDLELENPNWALSIPALDLKVKLFLTLLPPTPIPVNIWDSCAALNWTASLSVSVVSQQLSTVSRFPPSLTTQSFSLQTEGIEFEALLGRCSTTKWQPCSPKDKKTKRSWPVLHNNSTVAALMQEKRNWTSSADLPLEQKCFVKPDTEQAFYWKTHLTVLTDPKANTFSNCLYNYDSSTAEALPVLHHCLFLH